MRRPGLEGMDTSSVAWARPVKPGSVDPWDRQDGMIAASPRPVKGKAVDPREVMDLEPGASGRMDGRGMAEGDVRGIALAGSA